jgi:hypothetical protein
MISNNPIAVNCIDFRRWRRQGVAQTAHPPKRR